MKNSTNGKRNVENCMYTFAKKRNNLRNFRKNIIDQNTKIYFKKMDKKTEQSFLMTNYLLIIEKKSEINK